MVLDSVLLCWRPGEGRLDEGVSGLAAGMVSLVCARGRSLALLVWALWHVGVARGQRHLFLFLCSSPPPPLGDNSEVRHTIVIVSSARGRAGPGGRSIKLKACVAIAGLQRAHGQRHVGGEVVRVGQGEGGQRHGERA